MSGTPASTREAPARRFENYVLTRAIDSNIGLTNIDDKQFTKITAVSEIAPFDGTYVIVPIGFGFSIDGITYDQIAVDPFGWAALVDPALGTFNHSEVLTSTTNSNAEIKTTFTSNALLLAPWFDNIRNVLSDVSHLAVSPFSYSQEKITRISSGIEPPPPFWNPTSYGTSYYLDIRSTSGRRLIVRWSCLANHAGLSTRHIKFEVVLYECGKIEFRYAPIVATPQVNFISSEAESATIGIFAPGGANRFRDFAPGLGYLDQRERYTLGGAVYTPTFVDDGVGEQYDGFTSIPYVHNLWSTRNWPGSTEAGCIFTFAPPTNRLKLLPRNALKERDSYINLPVTERTGIGSSTRKSTQRFDDRRTIEFVSGTIVNYPTTLQRFYGGDAIDTTERQNLFTGDFLITASIVQSAIEQHVTRADNDKIEPYNETSNFEQSNTAASVSNLYFMSGSRPELFAGFDQKLKSKTLVKISLPVDYNVQLPGITSSIYYYNSRTHSWNVPQRTVENMLSSSTGTSTLGDWSNPATWHSANSSGLYGFAGFLNEDARGFGAFGNVLSSGSNTPSATQGTDYEFGRLYDQKQNVRALGKTYAKSARLNAEYQPTPNERFKLDIVEPFLIEKAVIEIPFSAGPGWFDDRTQIWRPIVSNVSQDCSHLNLAGPALTVALYRRIQFGKDYTTLGQAGGVSSALDLILTGTIIPTGDDTTDVVLKLVRERSPSYKRYFVGTKGFRVAGHPAGAVITPNASGYFTGSATVNTTALNSVGELLVHNEEVFFNDVAQIQNIYDFIQTRPTIDLNNPSIDVTGVGAGSGGRTYNSQIAPFGRASTGLLPSGRSALGRELSTLQGRSDIKGQYAANPYYLGPGALSGSTYAYISGALGVIQDDIALLELPSMEFSSPIPAISHAPCPYLVMPGDELVLSISKMHPFINSGSMGHPWLSGSVQEHDVGLITGSINITFYGSMLKEGTEFHYTSTQKLGSNAIHEVIGNEPVLDQIDTPYSRELSGSLNSRFNVEQVVQYLKYGDPDGVGVGAGQPIITASYETQRYYNSYPENDNQRTSSWSTHLGWTTFKKIHELKKSSRNTVFVTEDEIYYDCRVPEPASMLRIQSPGLSLASGTVGGVTTNALLFTGREYDTYLDYYSNPPDSGSRGMGDWIMSYPYENRWKDVSTTLGDRLRGATFRVPGYTDKQYVSYTHMCIQYGRYSNGTKRIASEAPNGTLVSSGIGMPEFIKFMYGFGDGRSSVADNCFVNFGRYNSTTAYYSGAEIRGWRHGVLSGFPLRTTAVFRRDRFGQFRDMLEQRLDTKFFTSGSTGINTTTSPVNVRFVDSDDRITAPEYTLSSNLSFECTSSLPFFDGEVRNREEPIVLASTNQSVVVI